MPPVWSERVSVSRTGEDSVRALQRGLEILRHVNGSGGASAGEIAKALNIPRPTVYRLLRTLEEAGYVAFSSSASIARVTRRAVALGDGYASRSELCAASAPLLAEYAARLIWPIDLSICDDAAMVIQETTHGRSPLSIDRGMVGTRLPMLRSSAGRAYLSFCPDAERVVLIEHLRRLGDPEDIAFLEEAVIERMLDETRARGCAIRDTGVFRPQTASLAMPLRRGDTVLGCVSIIWIRSAMGTDHAVDTMAGSLAELASRLALATSSA